MSIQSEIDRINNEVASQQALLSQITAALEGKTGGSGSSVKTCSLTIENLYFGNLWYHVYADGQVQYVRENDYAQVENAVCGSIVIMSNCENTDNVVCENATLLIHASNYAIYAIDSDTTTARISYG